MKNPRDDLMALADRMDEVRRVMVEGTFYDDYDASTAACGVLRQSAEAIRLAASRPAPVDREAVARAFIDGALAVHNEWKQDHEGENEGPPRGDPDFSEAAHDYVSLLRPAETVENVQSDIVAQRTWFEGENVRTENLTADDIYQKPDATSDAVGEPVAWIITWSDGETSFTRSAPSASSPKNCKYQPLYTHPPKSPDTSAEEMREALLDATANLVGAASAYRKHAARHRSIGRAIADPFFTARAGDLEKAAERAQAAIRQLPTTDTSAAVLAERERCAAIADEWANKMALNYGRETANTIAAAIRQLPTTERGE